jgi:hypothetical protein
MAAEQPRLTRRLAAAAFAALFAWSAWIQWNDPDPLRWMLLYGTACALCAWLALGRRPAAPLRWSLAGVAGVWALALAPRVIGAAAFTGTEEERELAGLVLVAFAALALPAAGWGSVERGAGDGPARTEGGDR